jgi:hypothetical protein
MAIFRDGTLVAPCASAEADPDPCVSGRARLGDGDIALTVLSSQSSVWEIAVAACTPRKPGVCRVPERPAASRLMATRGRSAVRDRLAWSWSGGPASISDFGDPMDDTSYVLCVADASAEVLLAAPATGGSSCEGKPCWRRVGTRGFKYVDKSGSADGLRTLAAKADAHGVGKLNARMRGPEFELPLLPFQLPLRVQLQVADGPCWEATFSVAGAKRNDDGGFKGKSQ